MALGWISFRLLSVQFHLSKPKPQEKLIKTATRWFTNPSGFCKHNWLDLHVALRSCAELLWCHKTGQLLYDHPNLLHATFFFVNHLHVDVSLNEQSSLFCDKTANACLLCNRKGVSCHQFAAVYSYTEREKWRAETVFMEAHLLCRQRSPGFNKWCVKAFQTLNEAALW